MMKFPSVPLLVLLLVFSLQAIALEPVWREDFETGLGTARPYRSDLPKAELVLASDNPASGESYLRATLPGERSLEGVHVRASGLTGERVVRGTAQVRGRGNLRFCFNSSAGWLYSPDTVALTDTWQTVSLGKVLPRGATAMSIHFLSFTAQPGVVFEVDDVRVFLEPPLWTADADVPALAFSVTDYVRGNTVALVDEPSAMTGKAVRADRYITFSGLPFPRTSRPVTVWLRVNPGTAGESYRLSTFHAGVRQVLRSATPVAGAGQWQWLKFEPLTAGEVGNSVGIDIRIAEGQYGRRLLDRVVLATDGGLDEAVLMAVPATPAARPLAQVRRCDVPPVIDGKGDEAAWEQAVVLTDFMEVRSTETVSARTTVRFLYDDENLYALYVSEEPILELVAQRTHEFRARKRQRDEDVWGDDSVALLLDPSGDGQLVYDFFVNALGTVTDARCTGPELWTGRDPGWDSGLTAAGHIGDGYWQVELAIPFADLGGTPSDGDVWGATVGRIARTRNETSSWNVCPLGFHDGRNMGALLFAGRGPGVALRTPALLGPGANLLKADLSPSVVSAPVHIVTEIDTGDSITREFSSIEAGSEKTAVEHEFTIKGEGEVQIAHTVLDAVSLRPVYATPRLAKSIRSTAAAVAVSAAGAYELYVNGRLLARGASAKAETFEAPLRKGVNVFALKLEQGTAAVRITPPGMALSAGNWKMAPAEAKDSLLPGTDDSGWQTAPVAGEGPAGATLVGEPGKAVVLRQTILWEETRQWPTPDPALFIARGGSQHLTFTCAGLEGRRLHGFTLTLAVPPEFEVIGSSGYYGHNPRIPRFPLERLGRRQVEGREFEVVRVTATEPVVTGRHYIMSLFNILVRYREELGEPAFESAEFVYWTEANERTVLEPPQAFTVRLLPPLAGKQPKKLLWQIWGSFFGAINKEEVREAHLQTFAAAGFNNLVGGGLWTSENGPRHGIAHTTGGMNHHAFHIHDYLRKHPEKRLIRSDGTPWEVRGSNAAMCTTALLDEGWEAMEEVVRNTIEKQRPQCIDYDFEYGPYKGSHKSCHCPRCLAEFRRHSGLGEDVEITARKAGDEYWEHSEKWVDFYAWRSAQIMLKFKETIQRLAPGTKYSIYSGYQRPENPRQYGVNWKYMADLGAMDYGVCGYGRSVPAIYDTVEAFQGIAVTFGAIVTPYRVAETWPQRPLTKAVLLLRLVDGRGGVMVYTRLPMDGRTLLASAETSRLAADFDDLFLRGARGRIDGLHDSEVQIVRHEGVTLVCVMNGTDTAKQWRIPLPAGAGSGQDFYTGTVVKDGQTVVCELAPGDIAVYVLRK